MVFYKRILNELHNILPKKLIEYNLDNKFYFVEIGNDIICNEIGVVNKKTNKLEMKFRISKDYPFKPPMVIIYDNDKEILYDRWASKIINNNSNIDYIYTWYFTIIKFPQLKTFSIYPEKNICLCCNNIICNSLWSPSVTLGYIMFEYINMRNLYIYTNNLNQKIINTIFHNDMWDLPTEIVYHIFSFIYNN